MSPRLVVEWRVGLNCCGDHGQTTLLAGPQVVVWLWLHTQSKHSHWQRFEAVHPAAHWLSQGDRLWGMRQTEAAVKPRWLHLRGQLSLVQCTGCDWQVAHWKFWSLREGFGGLLHYCVTRSSPLALKLLMIASGGICTKCEWGKLFSLYPVVMLEILKIFLKILSQSVEALKSKEAYLGGGGLMVLRVSWGPGGLLVSTEWQGFGYQRQ